MCERIPYLILPVRQLTREPFSSCRSVRRSSEPDRYERAAGQAAGHVSNHQHKRRERAIRQAAGPVSNHPPRRRERAAGQYATSVSIILIRQSASSEPSRIIRQSDIRKPCDTPPGMHQPTVVVTCARAGGRFQYRTEPLRLFTVNPLTVGEPGRRVIGEVILV